MTYPTDEQIKQLFANGLEHGADHVPVIFISVTGPEHVEEYLITETNPENPAMAYGLCQVNDDKPEIREQNLNELTSRVKEQGFKLNVIPIEKTYPLSVYEKAAEHGITLAEDDLRRAADEMSARTIPLKPKKPTP